jgi:ribosome maturation factor RimP
MLKESSIQRLVEELTAGTEMFLVDVSLQPGNKVSVQIDTPTGISVDQCGELNRALTAKIDRGDVEIEVSSPGLTKPFKVPGQYEKNLGREVEVLPYKGDKLKGTLVGVENGQVSLEVIKKEKVDGKKKEIKERKTIELSNIKKTKLVISI